MLKSISSHGKILWVLILFATISSCSTNNCQLEPEITYCPNQRFLRSLPSAFPPMTQEEMGTEWGKELYVGMRFASELDLYRAITCFKKALFLLNEPCNPRKAQIEFLIVESYYLGGKYAEALVSFEESSLAQAPLEFPPLHELLLMLYDSYIHTDQLENALKVLCLMESRYPETQEKIVLNQTMQNADFETLFTLAEEDCALNDFLSCYCSYAKSPRKAELLNAILPGAGYYYVGQKNAAITSFLINALFITAAYQFFERGYPAAGIITASIESGWYFGGINGAGLAAREYNERVYEAQAKEFMLREKLFPILQFNFAF